MGEERVGRLIGVYDADAGMLGELAFVTGRVLGLVRCALCEIMHGPRGDEPNLRGLTLAHGIEIRMLHRNEQPPDLRRVTEGNTPCIVAETDRGYEALVTRADLESCQGDVVCLDRLLQRALATRRPG